MDEKIMPACLVKIKISNSSTDWDVESFRTTYTLLMGVYNYALLGKSC